MGSFGRGLFFLLWTERSQTRSFGQPLCFLLWTERPGDGSLGQPRERRQQGQRHARGLAGARRGDQHRPRVGGKGGEQSGQDGVDGQRH
ncbi:MAG: hypothetical protein BGO82_12170 [Devosia sp. 67-54]|nr:MAG: hypothetical protein BGO82_12170 [Devosia sp. 67-54]